MSFPKKKFPICVSSRSYQMLETDPITITFAPISKLPSNTPTMVWYEFYSSLNLFFPRRCHFLSIYHFSAPRDVGKTMVLKYDGSSILSAHKSSILCYLTCSRNFLDHKSYFFLQITFSFMRAQHFLSYDLI